MGFKITVEATQDDGQVTTQEYTGESFLIAVPSSDGVFVESKVSSQKDCISLIAGAVTVAASAAKDNGYGIDDILNAISQGASMGMSEAFGNGGCNCEKCKSKSNKNVQGGTH